MNEPVLLKAGDNRLKINGRSPLVDCRVVAEDEYQRMLKRIPRPDFAGLSSDSHIQNFMDEFVGKQLDTIVSAESKLIISALQRHLPEVTEENIAQYAHRITRVVPPGKSYPIEYWLDINTKRRKLFIAMLEPVTTMDTIDGNYTVKTKLRYKM